MTDIYALAVLWLGLALAATLLSIWLRIATAMSEIIVGTVAQLAIGAVIGASALGTDQSWIRFLASTGAILLTFLAGAELDVAQPAKAKAAAAGVDCRVEIAVGHPAEQIVRYAEGHDVDHIVVGHRGHTHFERFLIGSVARQVIAYASCAVTVVRTARKGSNR